MVDTDIAFAMTNVVYNNVKNKPPYLYSTMQIAAQCTRHLHRKSIDTDLDIDIAMSTATMVINIAMISMKVGYIL